MKCSCGKELRNVGFEKGDNDKVVKENYICDNQRCSLYKEIQSLPPEEEE